MPDDMSVNGGIPKVDLEYLMSLYTLSSDQDLVNILMSSSIAQSPEQAVSILYSMGIPVLPEPNEIGGVSWSTNISAAGAILSSGMSKIGSDIWDSYNDKLEEQKERIKEYLDSPSYRQKLELQSPAFIAAVERNTPIDAQSPVRSATGYNEWLNSLPPAARASETERIDQHIAHATGLWNGLIDGVNNYVSQNKESDAGSVGVITAGFAITASYIGDYGNIVDVASTKMVAVNPIHDAAVAVSPHVMPQFQDQVTLAINLFAIGLMNFSNAEAIGNSLQPGGKPAATEDTVRAFARSVIDKVSGNEVNAFLMSLLISNVAKGEMTSTQTQDVVRTVKMTMIAIALAALYKIGTGAMTGQEFRDLLSGNLEPKSAEEKQLVGMLQQLYQEGVKASGGDSLWSGMMDSLIDYICGNPSVEELTDPTAVWTKLGARVVNPNISG